LVSASVSAFVIGVTLGVFLTFGPGPEAELAERFESAGSPATVSETTAIALAAGFSGDRRTASPEDDAESAAIQAAASKGGIDAAADGVSIGPTSDVKSGLQGPALANPAAGGLKPPEAIARPDPAASGEAEAETVAAIAKAALTPRPWKSQTVEVRRGDSLTTILKRAGIEGRQVHRALRSLRGVYDPRGLQAGQELRVTAAARDGQPAQLLSVALDLDFDHQLLITRAADGSFTTKKIEQAQRRTVAHRAGEIKDSLYLSARRADLPNSVTDRLIRLFSWDVDFQRDIRRGDRFETLYEEVRLEKDESQVRGELVYAGLRLRGRLLDAYLFTPDGGLRTYYDREGRSLRKFLLRTPIDGARLSSGFGMRRHPVLGYSRMHKGTDFAAPRGTPIYAGGSGKIERADRHGSYGNYIRIRHSDTWSTAYAHLNKFAKGIKPGVRVRQGQVIGYVGTTGRSTGPHLHYEVLKSGKQVNPMKMKQPSANQLAGAELAAFKREKARIDAERARLAKERLIASRAAAAAPEPAAGAAIETD
jgi:murein DD-endopeptidase MepM/ murein hydrolase activator NlpD